MAEIPAHELVDPRTGQTFLAPPIPIIEGPSLPTAEEHRRHLDLVNRVVQMQDAQDAALTPEEKAFLDRSRARTRSRRVLRDDVISRRRRGVTQYARRHRNEGRPTRTRNDYPNVERPMLPIPGGEGEPATTAAIDAIIANMDTAARNFAVLGAHEIEYRAQEHATAGFHSASHHGHIGAKNVGGPDVVSGQLRAAITVGLPVQIADGSWTADVGPAIVYGRAIELGMFRPAEDYRSTSPSAIRRRHPGFGGMYEFMRPAEDEFAEERAEELWAEQVAKAIAGA